MKAVKVTAAHKRVAIAVIDEWRIAKRKPSVVALIARAIAAAEARGYERGIKDCIVEGEAQIELYAQSRSPDDRMTAYGCAKATNACVDLLGRTKP